MKEFLSFAAFIATFVSLYGLLNYYFYRKAAGCCSFRPWARKVLMVFLLLMVSAPFMVNFAAEADLRTVAFVSALVGYTWMGAVFLFFCVHVPIDIGFGFRRLFRLVSGRLQSVPARRLSVFAFSVAVVSAALVWGFFEAREIRIEHVDLHSEKIAGPVRIVQVSDLHLGVLSGEAFAVKVAGLVDKLDADLLVSTGDMVDRGLADAEGAAAAFREVSAPAGKFAVAGNHEFYAGIEEAEEFHEMAGFTFLRNREVSVLDRLTIAGVDDPAGAGHGVKTDLFERRLSQALPFENFGILLKHQPVPSKGFDLQLSGHTHGGQIFPFNFIVGLVYPRVKGLHETEKGSWIYISRGTGFWGPPIRLFSPPEITVIDISSRAS
jgi:uncharacterized protein